MLVVFKEYRYKDSNGELYRDFESYRKAVNIETASEIYADGEDLLVINTQARNSDSKESGMTINYCRQVYHKTSMEIFDNLIVALQQGQKVYVL